jgi:putative transposase
MRDDDDVPNGTRWACFRHSIIGHLLASPPPAGELGAALDALASRTWVHPTSGEPVRCGRSTIERWLYLARSAGDPMRVLTRRRHAQLGKHPSMGPGHRETLGGLYAGHRSWSRQLLFDNVAVLSESDARLCPMPSYSTWCRYMRDEGMERQPRPRPEKPGQTVAREAFELRETRSFEASHVSGLWHSDFHDGSRKVLLRTGEWIIPQLLATMDDRSRLTCHAQWYATEDARSTCMGSCRRCRSVDCLESG